VPELLHVNARALAERSPETARLVDAAGADDRYAVTAAASGDRIVEWNGRALDSRRDPMRAAREAASDVTGDRVVLFGLGAGYLAEALLEQGRSIGAIVVPDAGALRAALSARAMESILASTPVFILEQLTDRVQLARVRARGDDVVVHAGSASIVPELRDVARRWASIKPARRPRLLVVGPVYGGSLGCARFVARAAAEAGAEVSFFDASSFASGHESFARMPVHARTQAALQGRLMLLLGEAIVETARSFGPDLVFAMAQAPLSEPSLTTLRAGGVPTAFWFVENCRVITYWRDMAPHYDWFYAIQPGAFLEDLRHAGAAHPGYLPMGCDPATHVPIELTAAERDRFRADVSFAGSPYLNRRHVFTSLTDFDFKLWGDGWQHTPLAAHAADNGARQDIEALTRIAAATQININLHSATHTTGLDPTPDYVNPRTFELASSRAFQLVDHRDPLRELFEPDEIVSFRNVAELRALVSHYLAHEDERVAIAARAQTRALRDHTYVQRMRRVIADTLPPDLVAGARFDDTPRSLEDAIAKVAGPTLSVEEALLRIVSDVREATRAL
jgi:spore maturation protein CgeB